MLINEPSIMQTTDPILVLIAQANSERRVTEIRTGIYQIGHFGSSHFLHKYEHYPKLTVGPYGVCDDVNQLLAACPELEASDRKFVVTVTPIHKADQPEDGGWRWHKWGAYIGTQNPQCEYLYDEPDIEVVMCYHIYERVH